MIDPTISEAPDVARIRHASEAIRTMADEVGESLKPAAETLSVRLRRATIQAPLQSPAVAFLLGTSHRPTAIAHSRTSRGHSIAVTDAGKLGVP